MVVYSIVVTLVLAGMVYFSLRSNKSRSSDYREVCDRLEDCRTKVRECRDVLTDTSSGLEGSAKRLREIAKKVQELEEIVNNHNPS